MKLAVIGAGNMGMSYAEGIIQKSHEVAQPILVLDNDPKKVENINRNKAYKASTSAAEILPEADYILLAIKPQIFAKVGKELAAHIKPEAVIISIGLISTSLFRHDRLTSHEGA